MVTKRLLTKLCQRLTRFPLPGLYQAKSIGNFSGQAIFKPHMGADSAEDGDKLPVAAAGAGKQSSLRH
jgi:hypothetical protein